MDVTSILVLAGFLAACFVVATTAAVFRPDAWYRALRKPSWNPPDWLFPPAWTVLYIMIAVAGWLVWRERGFSGAVLPFAAYVAQLLLNGLWSPIFFGVKRLDLAFYELTLLWASIVVCIILFAPISSTAALLLLPYLAWVSFAGLLNYTIWKLNPEAAPA